jgi:hypothetical protein
MHFPTNVGIKNSTAEEQRMMMMLSYNSGEQDGSLLLDKTHLITNNEDQHIFETT